MKRLLLTFALLLSTSCAYSTAYGDCIGVLDHEKANLEYHYSARNIIWTAVSPWTVVSPIVWFLVCAKCPTGYKAIEPYQGEYRLSVDPEFREQLATASLSKVSD